MTSENVLIATKPDAMTMSRESLAAWIESACVEIADADRGHAKTLMMYLDVKALLAVAGEEVCSAQCRSHFPAGHVRSDADHSPLCHDIRKAVSP